MGYMPKARFALVVLTLLSLVAGGGATEGAVLDPEELYELRVDNIFFDTFIRDALADISLQTGVPIVADTTVTGFVTLELVDVPLPVALEQLLWPAGYTFRWMDGYYLVGIGRPAKPLVPRAFSEPAGETRAHGG